MKWAAGFFSALFAVAAAVQWNDPDPLFWILGYGAASVLSALAAAGRVSVLPNAIAAIVFLLWFASLAPSLVAAPNEAFMSFEMRERSHEEPREAVGLVLCAVWSGVLVVWSRRRRVEVDGTASGR